MTNLNDDQAAILIIKAASLDVVTFTVLYVRRLQIASSIERIRHRHGHCNDNLFIELTSNSQCLPL